MTKKDFGEMFKKGKRSIRPGLPWYSDIFPCTFQVCAYRFCYWFRIFNSLFIYLFFLVAFSSPLITRFFDLAELCLRRITSGNMAGWKVQWTNPHLVHVRKKAHIFHIETSLFIWTRLLFNCYSTFHAIQSFMSFFSGVGRRTTT